MPVYAAIAPTFSSTEATLEALNSATFYTDSIRDGNKSHSYTTTLAHFEKAFVFMVDPKSSKWAYLYSIFIAIAAFTSCFVLFLQTLDGPNHISKDGTPYLYPDYPNLPTATDYDRYDIIFTTIFTLELIICIIIWPSLWSEHEYLTERRLKPFLKDFFNWFDVVAVLPFYTDRIFGRENSFVVMRLCRLLRIFKLARNHSGTYILLRAIKASLAPISIALIFFMEIVLFFSVVMYMVDPNVDRTKLGFSDLLNSGYYVVVTIATIGYGDITPTKGNVAGRVFSVMIIISGTLFLSMPLAIIGTEFDRAWKNHAQATHNQLENNPNVGNGDHRDGNENIDQMHEVLVKYNIPNRMYLRLAALTGEASLMVQALNTEVSNFKDKTSILKLQEIANDTKNQMDLCDLRTEELGSTLKSMIIAHVPAAEEKITFKKWLYQTLSDPNSSRLAKYIAKWINTMLISSMVVVVWQTMPDLQTYGETTSFCKEKVETYCTGAANVTLMTDPGCFAYDSPHKPIVFTCTEEEKSFRSECYGYGMNYGAAHPLGLRCDATDDNRDTWYAPFREKVQLSFPDRPNNVCEKWVCDNLHVTFMEFGNAYTVMEYIFTMTYIFEFAAAMFTCSNYSDFFKNPVVYIEMLSFIPFFVYEGRRIFMNIEPVYVIPPGSTDILTFFRLLRVFRIFKIQQSIPVTKVLWESISKTSTRLTIPYFMLILVTTILSFIMYELEKGVECFYGKPCIVAGKNMTTPPELLGSPYNKRFLVNSKGELSSFDDFFSAFWFVIVTLATIGYGDMEPVNSSGKFVAVLAMLFGACYTAMPLTLVGSQFNKSYREYKRREALLRTKEEVNKHFAVSQNEYKNFEVLITNLAFPSMRQILQLELIPLLDEMVNEDTIQTEKKESVNQLSIKLKEIIYNQRLVVMQVGAIVNGLRKEGIRLAEQQTTALQSVS